MNWRDIPFAGGFVYTTNEYQSVAHFKQIQLPGNRSFWCDDSKTLSIKITDDQHFAIVYGHFVDTLENVSDKELANSLLSAWQVGTEAFHSRIDRLAGRYVVCIGNKEESFVYHDATGLRSVYYSDESNLASSHINLLTSLEPHAEHLTVKGASLAADYSIFENVWQLVPNFRLAFEKRQSERFFPRRENPFKDWSNEDRYSRIESIWQKVMDGYAAKYDKIAISITGGMDSRLMLAMSKNYWHKLEAFTYGFSEQPESDSKWSKTMTMDFEIVSNLRDRVNFARHRFVEITDKQPVDPDLRATMVKNTSGRHGFYLVPHYRKLFEGDGWIHIRGTGPEIVRRQFGGNSSFESTIKTLTLEGSPDFTDRARAMGYDKDNFGYLSKDLAYWELRMGKWHSEILNETDAAYDTLLPMSVREIYEIMMSFSDFERSSALPIKELINRNVPEFNFLGMNDRRNLFEQWRDEKLTQEPKELIGTPRLLDAEGKEIPFYAGEPNLLYLPAESFVSGSSISADLLKMDKPGNLSIKFQQSWTSKVGKGYFDWKIIVDGKTVAKCDGSIISEPIHIKLQNLHSDALVSIGISAKRSPQSPSWARASKLKVLNVQVSDTTDDGGVLTVAADDNRVEVVSA